MKGSRQHLKKIHIRKKTCACLNSGYFIEILSLLCMTKGEDKMEGKYMMQSAPCFHHENDQEIRRECLSE